MWLVTLAFLLISAVWSAVLWLLLPIDIFDYAIPSIVAMHVGPPLLTIACWLLARGLVKRRAGVHAELAREERARLRDAEKEQHRKLFSAQLDEQRLRIDCRWVTTSDVIDQCSDTAASPEASPIFARRYATGVENYVWPEESVTQLLEELFAELPLAACLPIAVCGPADQSADAHISLAHRAHDRVVHKLGIQMPRHHLFKALPLSTQGTTIYKALTGLLEQYVDWPGVIVFAYESRTVTLDTFDANEASSGDACNETEKWLGKPSRALCAMLVTPALLSDALNKIDTLNHDVPLNSMTPFWDRQHVPVGMASFLAGLPKHWCDQLAATPVIAYLHRADTAEIDFEQPFARRVEAGRALVSRAAVNAALIEPPFEFDGDIETLRSPPIPLSQCQWLVHNAGNVAFCGDRMALLLSSLWQESVELGFDQTINTTMTFGDCGLASPWLATALAIQCARQDMKPAAIAWFSDRTLNVEFVVPAFPAKPN